MNTLTSVEYTSKIHELAEGIQKGKYIRVGDNGEIETVGTLKKLWENVRGLFGASNHCDLHRVSLSLLDISATTKNQDDVNIITDFLVDHSGKSSKAFFTQIKKAILNPNEEEKVLVGDLLSEELVKGRAKGRNARRVSSCFSEVLNKAAADHLSKDPPEYGKAYEDLGQAIKLGNSEALETFFGEIDETTPLTRLATMTELSDREELLLSKVLMPLSRRVGSYRLAGFSRIRLTSLLNFLLAVKEEDKVIKEDYQAGAFSEATFTLSYKLKPEERLRFLNTKLALYHQGYTSVREVDRPSKKIDFMEILNEAAKVEANNWEETLQLVLECGEGFDLSVNEQIKFITTILKNHQSYTPEKLQKCAEELLTLNKEDQPKAQAVAKQLYHKVIRFANKEEKKTLRSKAHEAFQGTPFANEFP